MCNWKRWTTNITMACFFLAGGIEYSVIFPTILDYLQTLGGKEWLYGLSLSAFSISNFFVGPLFGYVFDKTHRTRLIVLFANLFEIGGNLMYFAATSKYMILGSRFLTGVGGGAGAVIFGELARTTTQKMRTRAFSVFMSMKLIGITIGPAFNLFLRECNFKIGPFVVNKHTAPGAFMVMIWIIAELMWLVLFHKFPSVEEAEKSDHNSVVPTAIPEGSITSDTRGRYGKMDKPVAAKVRQDSVPWLEGERTPLLLNESCSTYSVNLPPGASKCVNCSAAAKGSSPQGPSLTYKGKVVGVVSEFLREEIVVLLGMLFLTMFNQIALEAAIVPLAKNLLNWKEVNISIFYSVAGAETILGFVIVYLLSKKVTDRWQILIGLGLELFGYCWLLGTIGNATNETPWVLWRFIVGMVPILFGLPFFVVTGASLYSKILPMKIQGFGQGFRRSVFAIAAILGPIWVGGAVSISYYLLFGVPFGLLIFLVSPGVLLSFPKLKEQSRTQQKSSTAEDILTASLQA